MDIKLDDSLWYDNPRILISRYTEIYPLKLSSLPESRRYNSIMRLLILLFIVLLVIFKKRRNTIIILFITVILISTILEGKQEYYQKKPLLKHDDLISKGDIPTTEDPINKNRINPSISDEIAKSLDKQLGNLVHEPNLRKKEPYNRLYTVTRTVDPKRRLWDSLPNSGHVYNLEKLAKFTPIDPIKGLKGRFYN